MPLAAPASYKGRFAFSKPLFIASLVCLCLDEAFAIRGLWFRSQPAHHLRGFDLPFLVWTPALGAFLLMLSIRRMIRRGQLSPSLAAGLSSGIALLLLVAYLLMTRLAQIAFL
ncbi:MAG TPA: hypothetical protein VGI45_18455 [Terracidiphilus sp.]|jgi:hypothetical protein